MNHRPLLIVGLDSADYRLCEKWAEAGKMPHFKRFMENSRKLKVRNPRGFEAGSLWPCFNMGCDVDHHGQFDGFNMFDPTLYSRRRLKAKENANPYFWQKLSQAGRKVLVVDVPYVPLVNDVNGIQVVDWMTHVRTGDRWLQTSPRELAEIIKEQFGVNPFSESASSCPTDHLRLDTAKKALAMRDTLKARIQKKSDFLQKVIGQEKWDCCYCVFHEAHDMGHMGWHIHDTNHSDHDPDLRAKCGDLLENIYTDLDQALGNLIKAMGEDAAIHVFCSHGMGEERTATFFLDEILLKLELHYRPLLGLRDSWIRGLSQLAGKDPELYRPVISLRQRVSHKIRSTMGMPQSASGSDKRHRYFFEVINNQATGSVRFNLRGREKNGLLDREKDMPKLMRRLKKDLLEITNTESGEPLIQELIPTGDLYSGPKLDSLPDLLLEWNQSAPIRAIHSPLFGTIKVPGGNRSGDHTFKSGALYSYDSNGTATANLIEDIHVKDIANRLIESILHHEAR